MSRWTRELKTLLGAAIAALAIGYLAHNQFGMSPTAIRTDALEAVAVVGVTLASRELMKKNDS
jgi:hypothetical protein